MRASPMPTLLLAAAAGAAIGLAWPPPAPAGHASTGDASSASGDSAPVASAPGEPGEANAPAPHRGPASASAPAANTTDARGAALRTAGAAAALASWPVSRRSASAGGSANTTSEPVVPVRLAFRALWYLGVDPAAEVTWNRAINDPRSPAGVRSDLIVDMVDEGYTDNDRPGLADLALIERRLEILERYSPHAMDEVNARAFEEAYRTLLALYLKLGGKARIPQQVR